MNNQLKPKKHKSFENKLTQTCSYCSATFTLKETHLQLNNQRICATNCLTKWEELLNKHCQEKVLANELEKEQAEESLADKVEQLKKDSN